MTDTYTIRWEILIQLLPAYWLASSEVTFGPGQKHSRIQGRQQNLRRKSVRPQNWDSHPASSLRRASGTMGPKIRFHGMFLGL